MAASRAQEPEVGGQATERDTLNAVLHMLLGFTKPCQTACTHVIDGRWTALGAANVLARVPSGAASSPESKVEELMANLERSVADAKAARQRKLEADAAARAEEP